MPRSIRPIDILEHSEDKKAALVETLDEGILAQLDALVELTKEDLIRDEGRNDQLVSVLRKDINYAARHLVNLMAVTSYLAETVRAKVVPFVEEKKPQAVQFRLWRATIAIDKRRHSLGAHVESRKFDAHV